MLFISQNDVKELIIEDKHTPKFGLPLYVFQCDELQHLKLNVRALELHPPLDFGGFRYLLSLDLSGLPDGGEISNLVSKCPLLERLSVHLLDCRLPLVVDAPRLRFLHALARFSLNAFLQLKNVCSLTAILLRFGDGPRQLHYSQLIDIFNFMPKVEAVTLQSLHTIVVIPQDPLTSVPTTLHYLKNLTILDTCISSLVPILSILQSTPNLQMLNVGIRSSATSVDEAALHFLDQIREPRTLNSLLAVNIEGLLGSKVEIMFIKLILSCSPVLKTLHLTGAKHLTAVMPLTATENFHSEAESSLLFQSYCSTPDPHAKLR